MQSILYNIKTKPKNPHNIQNVHDKIPKCSIQRSKKLSTDGIDVEIIRKKFKVVILNVLQEVMPNTVEMNRKVKKSQKSNNRHENKTVGKL